MIMGGEIYLADGNDGTAAWPIGRELGLPVAAHIVGRFGMQPEFDAIAAGQRPRQFDSDNLFIHMTGMSDWAGRPSRMPAPAVSLAVPIEMNMRHGMPPILKTRSSASSPRSAWTSRSRYARTCSPRCAPP